MWIEPLIGPMNLEIWKLLRCFEGSLTSMELETKIRTEVQRMANARARCDLAFEGSTRPSGSCDYMASCNGEGKRTRCEYSADPSASASS